MNKLPLLPSSHHHLRKEPVMAKRIEVKDHGEITVVRFTDKKLLDDHHRGQVDQMADQLFALVDEGHKKILLNFSGVEYLCSAALGKYIFLQKKIHAAGGQLVLCNIKDEIYEVFEITKLNYLFECVPDEQAALEKF